MARKRREHTRKHYGPTEGWAMRMSQRGIVPSLGRTSGPGRSTMGLLESHAIPGVVPCGLSIVHEETTDKAKREKKRSSEQTSGIMTLPCLLRECSHALRLRHQRCPRKVYSRHRLPRVRAAYHDEVEWGEVDQPVARKSGVLGGYPQPSLVREWQAVPV